MSRSAIREIAAGRDDVRLEATGLHLPEGMSREDWCRVGERLRDTQQSLMWWVGDWLRFGERRHGVTYAEAAELTGYKEGSLRTAVWMAGQFDLSMRIDKLTWHHHRHAAALSAPERVEVLQRAVQEGLSTRELKALVTDRKRREAPEPGEPAQQASETAAPAPTVAPSVDTHRQTDEPRAEPVPAPDPDAKLRTEFRRLTPEAQEDDWVGLRAQLKDETARRKKAEAEVRRLKELVKGFEGEQAETIRRQAGKIRHLERELGRANENASHHARSARRAQDECKRLRAQLEAQEVPL